MRKITIKLHLLSLIFISLVGCNPAKEIAPEIINLTAKEHVVDNLLTVYPGQMILKDSLIYIMDYAVSNMFYTSIKYPQFELIESFGEKGKGPNEIMLCTAINSYKDSVYYIDGSNGKLVSYKSNTAKNKTPSIRYINSDKSVFPAVDFRILDCNKYAVGDFSGKNRFKIVENTIVTEIEYNDNAQKQIKENNSTNFWRSYMDYNQNLNLLALACQFGDYIELYDLNSMKYKSEFIGEDGLPTQGVGMSSKIQGYCDIKWIGDEVYALYWGKTEMKSIREDHLTMAEIRVFDVDCNLLKIYKLNSEIISFDVDVKNNTIIGIAPRAENPLVTFEF